MIIGGMQLAEGLTREQILDSIIAEFDVEILPCTNAVHFHLLVTMADGGKLEVVVEDTTMVAFPAQFPHDFPRPMGVLS